jgi:hypothetical protein
MAHRPNSSFRVFVSLRPVEGDAAPTSVAPSSKFVDIGVTGSVNNVYLSPYAGNSSSTSNTAYNVINANGSATYTVDSYAYSILWGEMDPRSGTA